jgi:hypothetical protein
MQSYWLLKQQFPACISNVEFVGSLMIILVGSKVVEFGQANCCAGSTVRPATKFVYY